jgi:hypothetical protein
MSAVEPDYSGRGFLRLALRIHFLNIGAGSCAIVECPGANAAPMIVDCGSTGATPVDMTAQQTRAYIQNILALYPGTSPNVVLSHPDLDRYAHIPTALDNVTAASVWQGGDTDAYSSANFPTWLAKRQMGGAVLHRNFAAHFHNSRQPVSADLSCGAASTLVLTANTGSSNNAQSLLLMIEYEGYTAMFTGDAEGTEGAGHQQLR